MTGGRNFLRIFLSQKSKMGLAIERMFIYISHLGYSVFCYHRGQKNILAVDN